jgi:mitotic spindle assembly checkpoint protein MAD2
MFTICCLQILLRHLVSHTSTCGRCILWFVSSGIYQPESFKRESKYGLTVLTTTDEGLLKYLSQVMAQVEAWLLNGDVQRLVVVVTGVDSGETLERWQFNVTLDDEEGDSENSRPNSQKAPSTKKTMKEIHGEIQAIIRQVTASVTFLPLLNEPCSFDMLVYTNKDAAVPAKWEDSDPCYIMNSSEVKLRSFTTSVSLTNFLLNTERVYRYLI